MSGTYPVALFNDIHRYFPAVLYEPERFSRVSELLQYIRTQIRNHSDPYVHGLYTYNTTQRQSRPTTPHAYRSHQYPPSGPTTAPPTTAPPTTAPPTTRWSNMNTIPMSMLFERTADIPFQSVTENMIRELIIPGSSLLNELIGVPTQHIMEPVSITPTAQQIAAASTVSTVGPQGTAQGTAQENTCAVCQDVMSQGSEIRTLNRCEHTFHIGCIDTWFRRNVVCPMCRHDIREV